MPTWQMGYQDYQLYLDFQDYETNQTMHRPSHLSHYPSFQNHLPQSWASSCENYLPIWLGEDWQAQNPQSYQSQVYPSQDRYYSHPQQGFELPLNINRHTNSIEEKIEGVIISQQSMRSCLKSNDELTLEMQNAHDEHKASIDEMIKQASLLANIMKEIQEDKARFRANEQRLDEENASEPEEEEPSSTELELGIPPEKHGEVRNVEVMLAREKSRAEGELIAMPLNDETQREIPEEANDEPQERKEEVIKDCVGPDATLFYLQARTVHLLDEKVEKLVSGEAGENAPVERPPPVIDKPDECCKEEGPRLENERARKGAARQIYFKQLEPWPKLLKDGNPSDHGLRPKDKKNIQGTYKNHKKSGK